MKQNEVENWWKKTVVYQIYPKSFQDSNGDGIGDIRGIISRLDYLQELGIGAIWLSPVCCSPQDDNGYDISDYQDIDPMFGNMKDMELLIAEAEKRGIRLILDLVLNHTSDEHRWFQEALKGRDNPYHDYYVWRDGTEEILPNEMRACFGGSAWQWVPELGQYYFHQFSVRQPDLNWDNPKVRGEISDMINWWIEKGVGGFRLDVIDQIAKEPELEITGNGPMLHAYIRELSSRTFRQHDLITVGETWGANTENARIYSNPDGSEFSMIFQFEHSCLDQQPGKEKWDLAPLNFLQLKKVMAKWQKALYKKGWNSLFWNNHDLPRIVSRWGDDKAYRIESAKMLATVLHGMQGTPYIYQGEELAMTNVCFPISEYRDIETLHLYEERLEHGYNEDEVMKSIYTKGRDNARTPMQWDDSEYAGFTSGSPWMKVNPNFREINALSQLRDEDSVFSYYKKLVGLRKDYEIFVEGDFELLYPDNPDIFAYVRSWQGQKLLVAANFHGGIADFTMPEEFQESGLRLAGNYQDIALDSLRPYEAFMRLIK